MHDFESVIAKLFIIWLAIINFHYDIRLVLKCGPHTIIMENLVFIHCTYLYMMLWKKYIYLLCCEIITFAHSICEKLDMKILPCT